MAKKTIPKRDGSGQGNRSNKGRSGCSPTKSTGKGCNSKGAGRRNK